MSSVLFTRFFRKIILCTKYASLHFEEKWTLLKKPQKSPFVFDGVWQLIIKVIDTDVKI